MLSSDTDSSNTKGSVLPAGSGSDVWVVYNYDMTVAARKCTSGSWGSQEAIYTATGTLNFIDTAPASALVDEDGVLHVVYGDGTTSGSNQRPHIRYSYRNSAGWASSVRLDSTADSVGQRYPTISLDASTGNVYAMWIQRDNNNVLCKKNVSGTWSFVSIDDQTTYSKQHLTSVYSVIGEGAICWQWTQNSTSPYHVIFDKIPEFSDAVLPVLFVLTIFVAVQRRRSRPDLPA